MELCNPKEKEPTLCINTEGSFSLEYYFECQRFINI